MKTKVTHMMKHKLLFLLTLCFISLTTSAQKHDYKFFQKGGYMGMKDNKGKIIVQASKYPKIIEITGHGKFFDDSCLIVKGNMADTLKMGVINYKGEEILKPVYDNILSCQLDQYGCYFLAELNNKKGFLTKKGKFILPIIFDDISVKGLKSPFPYIEVIKKRGNKRLFGVYDLGGHIIIPAETYTAINRKVKSKYNYYYYSVEEDDYFGIIDIDGNILIPTSKGYKYAEMAYDERSSNGMIINAGYERTAWLDDKLDVYDAKTLEMIENYLEDLPRKQIIKEANKLYDDDKFKKASKEYSKAIEMKAEDYTLFKRGLCYYHMGKFKKAQEDFQSCYNITKSSEYKSKAKNNFEVAGKKREEARQQNGLIALGLLGAAAMTYSAISAPKNSNNSSSSVPSGGSYSSSSSSSSGYSSTSSNGSTTSSKSRCGLCSGKGSYVEYTSNYGVSKTEYCSECGKNMMSNHYHKTCTLCHGKGYK